MGRVECARALVLNKQESHMRCNKPSRFRPYAARRIDRLRSCGPNCVCMDVLCLPCWQPFLCVSACLAALKRHRKVSLFLRFLVRWALLAAVGLPSPQQAQQALAHMLRLPALPQPSWRPQLQDSCALVHLPTTYRCKLSAVHHRLYQLARVHLQS